MSTKKTKTTKFSSNNGNEITAALSFVVSIVECVIFMAPPISQRKKNHKFEAKVTKTKCVEWEFLVERKMRTYKR